MTLLKVDNIKFKNKKIKVLNVSEWKCEEDSKLYLKFNSFLESTRFKDLYSRKFELFYIGYIYLESDILSMDS